MHHAAVRFYSLRHHAAVRLDSPLHDAAGRFDSLLHCAAARFYPRCMMRQGDEPQLKKVHEFERKYDKN
jgi:hypothetical protein